MLIGLVGKPSVGKSTFFKAATLAEVEISQRPFTTIKPNHGVGYVKIDCVDSEFNVQCTPKHGYCVKGKRFVPVELMDVAGLVPGASEGRGLGNKFLDDLREADAFVHIVDISGKTDAEGKTLPEGSLRDPSEDVVFLENELDRWYHGIFMKAWKSFSKSAETESRENLARLVAKQFSGLKIKEDDVRAVLKGFNFGDNSALWTNNDLMRFSSDLRRLSKPMIIAANKIDAGSGDESLERLKIRFPKMAVIPCSADSELALREAARKSLIDYIPGDRDFAIKADLNHGQKKALETIRKNVLEKYESGTGIQEVLNRAVFQMLNYIAVFPAGAKKLRDSKGNILPDCFLLPSGSTALDFAYFLHTDFGRNFIKAIDARSKRALGKDHALKNRDALEIVTK
jgi:ribosome-binding ATPase YchF (GTP1/OBG family)